MSAEFEQKLQAMSEKFREELPARYKVIVQLFDQLINDNQINQLEILKQELHRLTGSAGTFGLNKVSSSSLQLEAFIETAFTSPPLSHDDKEILNYLYDHLSLEVRAISLCHYTEEQSFGSIEHTPLIPEKSADSQKNIVIIEDDLDQAEHYRVLLLEQGYKVDVFHHANANDFAQQCCSEMPDLFLVDMILGDNKNAGADFIKQLQQQSTLLPPVVFASVRDDFDARLAAVRAGGSRYLVKPFSDDSLIDSVRSLTEKETPPYRVLIIEDEQEVADYFVTTMENADIVAEAIYNPLEAMDKVKQFKPELIMMDIHMPGCNGLELAAMIRHQEYYSKLPIVFLSADYGLQNRLSAMTIGVDDFIPKGIEPYQIVASVKSRLTKARLINTLTGNLTEQREKAEKASDAKSRFLSFITHELKTPLNAVLGYSDILKHEDISNEQKEMVAEIHSSGEMQLELIHELLDLSMIEEGKISLNPQLLPLNELISNTITTIKLQAQKLNITISVEMADNITIEADEKRLRQILLNLLSNAVKYNNESGKIHISAQQNNKLITLSVVDSGKGISEKGLIKLFSPFDRLEADRTEIEGTGLGLGIVKNLIDLMGGTIAVESSQHKGSSFTITLPARQSK